MTSQTPELWNVLISTLRHDQVLALLRLGLEEDNAGDAASDLETRSKVASSEVFVLCGIAVSKGSVSGVPESDLIAASQ